MLGGIVFFFVFFYKHTVSSTDKIVEFCAGHKTADFHDINDNSFSFLPALL